MDSSFEIFMVRVSEACMPWDFYYGIIDTRHGDFDDMGICG